MSIVCLLRGHDGGQSDAWAHQSRWRGGGNELRTRPHWPGSLQCAGRWTLWPPQTQVHRGRAQAAAHDQKGQEGVCARWAEGMWWEVVSVILAYHFFFKSLNARNVNVEEYVKFSIFKFKMFVSLLSCSCYSGWYKPQTLQKKTLFFS